jgi:hypothetical protein
LDEELPAFDKRETGYDRLLIVDHNNNNNNNSNNRIQRIDELLVDGYDNGEEADCYNGTFLEPNEKSTTTADVNVWVYVPQTSDPPTKEYPIIQSYVDICMRGCLSISKKFLHEFLKTTYGWHPQEIIDLMKHQKHHHHQQQQQQQDANDKDGTSIISGEEAVLGSVLGSWSNDRHSPIYPRADGTYSLENAIRLDRFLEQAALPVDSVRA